MDFGSEHERYLAEKVLSLSLSVHELINRPVSASVLCLSLVGSRSH